MMHRIWLAGLAATMLGAAPPVTDRSAERAAMVAAIERHARSGPADHRRIDPRVLRAMSEVPRHRMVPADVRALAYADRALPIGHDATISQPYIVALMTDLADPDPGDVVLEVGTGSGYQAAVLSRLVRHVYSIEIVEPLAQRAARTLRELGYANVSVKAGDGYAGWPAHAPFDAILVTAGASHVPEPLLAQLKPGGRMIIPVGRSTGRLDLLLIAKDRSGRTRRERVIPVSFVPLVRESG